MSRFAAPAPEGDKLAPADIEGHLLAVIPTEYRTGIVTQYTKPGEDPSDAISVHCVVLTQQGEDGQPPVYRDALWFNVSLKNTLRKQIGEVVLARMAKGQAKPGQSAPFYLADATSDAGAVGFAEQWLDQHPEFEAEATKRIAGGAGLAAPAAPAAAPIPASVPTIPMQRQAPAQALPQAQAPVAFDPSMLANLPAEEQAKILALLQQG